MYKPADWLAWMLQFAFGLIVGVLAGCALLMTGRYRHYHGYYTWSAPGFIPLLLAGTGLIGAALASYYGDRLWLASSYRTFQIGRAHV
jgi:hypothetical protein